MIVGFRILEKDWTSNLIDPRSIPVEIQCEDPDENGLIWIVPLNPSEMKVVAYLSQAETLSDSKMVNIIFDVGEGRQIVEWGYPDKLHSL